MAVVVDASAEEGGCLFLRGGGGVSLNVSHFF
jgi:hypothetical protein